MCEELFELGDTSVLGNVILYDQIPRHVFRHQQANHIITYFLHKSLAYLQHLDTKQLNDAEWVFAMLPLRHAHLNLDNVIKVAWERYKLSENEILRRFIKASYHNIPETFNFFKYEFFEFTPGPVIPFKCPKYADILDFVPTKPLKLIVPIAGANFPHDKVIVVSLSGGVDSMVCLHNLYMMGKKILAVHINYSNHGLQNDREEQFLIDWCDYLQIDLYVMRTSEINRELCMQFGMRDEYETYTRKRRFAAYKLVGQGSVVLGHNKDDVLENIMTNIASQTKFGNLDGMSKTSVEDGITFHRPILDIQKNDIIKYAQYNNIPYLKNSTPVWSQRGQIRDIVLPVLDAWNVNFQSGLHKLSRELAEMSELINDVAKNSELNRLPKTKCKMFWSALFSKIAPSKKSLDHFIQKIQVNGKFKAVLKKGHVVSGVSHEDHISLKMP